MCGRVFCGLNGSLCAKVLGALLLVTASACRDKDSGVLVESDSDVEVDTEPGTDTDPGTDADTDPGTDADTDPGTDADTDPGTDADSDTDADADTEQLCGNGVVDPHEACDGDCATTCDDLDECTTDTLAGDPLDCDVTCESVAIVECVDGDGCCAPGCDSTEDSDCEAGCDPTVDECEPECGNGVVEADEDCDDGNTDPNDVCDDCTFADAHFRVTDLDLRDPHVFADLPFVGCTDATDQPFGQDGVNPLVQASIEEDDNNDGLLDLSLLLTFPERLPSATTGPVELTDANCTAPARTTMCTPQPSASTTAWTYTEQTSGTCLSTVPGTTRNTYTPGIVTPDGPCFVTDATAVVVNTGLVSFTLLDTQLAASDISSPPTGYESGVLRGFLTQTEAETVVFPADTPFIGGNTLASVLRGHSTNCSPQSDMDMHPTFSDGWWMYFNFSASKVPAP